MRITTVRIIVQAIVFALFLAFVFVTTFANLDRVPALAFWVNKFLEIDPLIGVSTALATHTVYRGLLWSLILIVPTLFLGRFFCNWICPFGTMHHFTGWSIGGRKPVQRIEANRYRSAHAIKYYVLIFVLVAAAFGSLQIGLLDPIALLHRSFTAALLPAMNMPPKLAEIFGDPKLHQLSWLIGFLIFFLVALNLVIPRFFCRVICPLGAMLGVFSRFSLWRIDRDPAKCNNCNQCLKNCEAACDPHTQLRKSECFVCFNCVEDCSRGALRYAFLPNRSREVTWPDVPRRRAIFAATVGVLFFPFAKLSGRTTRDFSSRAIRPPGSVEEREFLARCIKCAQCIRACPTNVLQPAGMETGLEGLWTPVMNYRVGYCQLTCTACGHVCPTGAIQRLSVDRKMGVGTYRDEGPVRMGTAHYDLGRCLPWAKNLPCVVCEEVCPVSPKAIHTEYRQMLVRDGKKQVRAATATTVSLLNDPTPGQVLGEPTALEPGQFRGDPTVTYHVRIFHRDGRFETHRILDNDVDTLLVGQLDAASGQLVRGVAWDRAPQRGQVAAIYMELKVPKIDTEQCIGCGICEKECPIVGDRRGVYVTAEGETRSQHYGQEDRNRSLRLIK